MKNRGIGRIEAKSLKARCVEELERRIIAGLFAIGESLPPERELATRLGVSRPVIHEAMVELAAKGFVVVEPRRGARVNDFYRSGTLAIFESIVRNDAGEFSTDALRDILAFRLLIETETARLAASRRGGEYASKLAELVERETHETELPASEASLRDFAFHLLVAEASGSLVYPLVINTLRPLYVKLVERFYASLPDRSSVLVFHRHLLSAIEGGDAETAVRTMGEMLEQGARVLG